MSNNNNRPEWAPKTYDELPFITDTNNTYLLPYGIYIEHDHEECWDPKEDSFLEQWLEENIGIRGFEYVKENYTDKQSTRCCKGRRDGSVYLFETVQEALAFYERFAFFDYHYGLPVGQTSFVGQNAQYPHSVFMSGVPGIKPDGDWPEADQMNHWLLNNCNGNFDITGYKLKYQIIAIFDDITDAVGFKIMFGEWC